MAAPHAPPLSKPAPSLLISAVYPFDRSFVFGRAGLAAGPAALACTPRRLGPRDRPAHAASSEPTTSSPPALEVGAFIRASVYVRLGFAIGAALLVLVGQMPPALLLLGAVDAAGAGWTALELQALAPGRLINSSAGSATTPAGRRREPL